MFKTLGQVPSLENLMCFVAAAEQLNFRKASKQLLLSPAAFGQRIKQLESQLGCLLFERTSRSIALTTEGHRLLPSAQSAIREAMRCREVVHEDRSTQLHMTIGTRFELGMSWLLPALAGYERLHPHVTVDMYFGSGPDILEKLRQKEIDGIVTSAPQLYRSWAAEFLHSETYTFVGERGLLEELPFDSDKDAQRHTLIDIDASLPLTRYLTSSVGDLSFASVRLCGAGAAVLWMVEQGKGVAVLPEYMVQRQLAEGSLVKLLPEASLLMDSFRLIFDRGFLFREELGRLAEYLRQMPLQ